MGNPKRDCQNQTTEESMATKKKTLANNPDATTNPDPNTTGSTTTKKGKKGRKAGKDIVPRLKVIDGQSFILMASSRSKNMKSGLLWAPQPRDPDNAFCFMFDLPSGEDDGGSVVISVPMAAKQAQAVYAAHPRRVPKHEMPPECPLEPVEDEDPEPEPPASE